jgi:hypothetical protein
VVSNAEGDCIGQEFCIAGAWVGCNAQTPAAETCNNVDDNCNSVTDEGLSQGCSIMNGFGTCNGTETCDAGGWINCSAMTPAPESCDNVDNNCNGSVDENLVQQCSNTNVFGTCVGSETCSAGGWLGCTAAIPVAESCNNADDDCDGAVDENLNQQCAITNAFGTCFGSETCVAGSYVGCTALTPAAEVCNSAFDEDCDGLVGCNDPDCVGDPACIVTETNCNNGLDDDGDGPIDCADGDCAASPFCNPETNCGDGLDNDGDGDTDCLDSDCAGDPACTAPFETSCSDGIDNDGDGDTDCLDLDCAGDADCNETNCSDGVDNDGDTYTDCADSECVGDPSCVGTEANCYDGLDNDGNGLFDCADPVCQANALFCFGTESCGDGIDNDGDGLTDCEDYDCSGQSCGDHCVCLSGDADPYDVPCEGQNVGDQCGPGQDHSCNYGSGGVCESFANLGGGQKVCVCPNPYPPL